MGYSIYVACPDKATMEEMYEFLLKNYKHHTLRKDGLRYHSEGRGREDPGSLDYVLDTVEFPVGFDYNCMAGPERIYMFAVVKWMAWALLPEPAYHYDTEEVFPVKESPIDIDSLRKELKQDPIVERDLVKDFAEEMFWDLWALDIAWKARSGVAEPTDFWEAVEKLVDWWETEEEDREGESPIPYAEEMKEFFRHGPLAQVKKWLNLAVDTCPDIEGLGHWLDHLATYTTPRDMFDQRRAESDRVGRRQEALFKVLEKRGIE